MLVLNNINIIQTFKAILLQAHLILRHAILDTAFYVQRIIVKPFKVFSPH